MCFHYEITKAGATPKYVPYLNPGLFFGQGKVQGGDDVKDTRNHISVIPTLLEGMRPSKRNLMLGQYLLYHKEDLQRECQVLAGRTKLTANIFLEESVGGFGVQPPEGFRVTVTDQQRRLAATIYQSNPFLGFKADIPEEDREELEFTSVDESLRAPWLAPQREAGPKKFPELVSGYISKKRVRAGFCWLRTKRPHCDLQGVKEPSYGGVDQLDMTRLEQDFEECEKNRMYQNLCLYQQMEEDTRNGSSLQQLALRTLWRNHKDSWHGKISEHHANAVDWIEKHRPAGHPLHDESFDFLHLAESDFLAEKWKATVGRQLPPMFNRCFDNSELFTALTVRYGVEPMTFMARATELCII